MHGRTCSSRTKPRNPALLLAAGVATAIPARAQEKRNTEWGGPILDVHLHVRAKPEGVFDHIEGSGETRAVLLPRQGLNANAKAAIAAHPGMLRKICALRRYEIGSDRGDEQGP
jgi:hypothetical protein